MFSGKDMKDKNSLKIRRNDLAYFRMMIPAVIFLLIFSLAALLFFELPPGALLNSTALVSLAGLFLICLSLLNKKPIVIIYSDTITINSDLFAPGIPVVLKIKRVSKFKFDTAKDIPIWINTSYRFFLKECDKDAFGRSMWLFLNNGRKIGIPYLRIKPEDRCVLEEKVKAIVAENNG